MDRVVVGHSGPPFIYYIEARQSCHNGRYRAAAPGGTIVPSCLPDQLTVMQTLILLNLSLSKSEVFMPSPQAVHEFIVRI
jgi:hypothetical protein